MNSFENKVIVITGGNSGIGLATAKELRRRGAQVVISGRDEKSLAEASNAIGGDTLALRADVSKIAEIEKLFATVKQRFAGIRCRKVLARSRRNRSSFRREHGYQFQRRLFHSPEGVAATS